MTDKEREDLGLVPLADDQIVTERKIGRRSFLGATGALLIGAAALVSGVRADARGLQAADPDAKDKKAADPDKKKGAHPGEKKGGDPDKKKEMHAKGKKGGDPDKKKAKAKKKGGDPDKKKKGSDPDPV